ncbi:MAG: methionine--tRNA ligase subunit beta [Acidobacteria bacterium]|nr:MAG: methionine--tRNA ligase subunit beta [Acidobacteriota bacterium]
MISCYSEHMQAFKFHRGLQAVWEFVGLANRYIVANEPWKLAKDEALAERLDTVLYNILESLRLLTLVVQPVMPGASARMAEGLGLALDSDLLNSLTTGGAWGRLPAGIVVQAGGNIFPRLEAEKDDVENGKAAQGKGKQDKKQKGKSGVDASLPDGGLVSFDDFKKLDLRVAEIVAAEPVKKSDRLLKLTVKAPDERTIVAGIAEYYKPDELIGSQVIIVANLKPAKLMGVTSQGMVLAAKTGEGDSRELVLSAVSKKIKAGSQVA